MLHCSSVVLLLLFCTRACFSLHILSITADVKLLATIYVILEQALYELFLIYRNPNVIALGFLNRKKKVTVLCHVS